MPSIMTTKDEHRRYCSQPEGGWLGDMAPEFETVEKGFTKHYRHHDVGDGRRCVHGYVMLGYEVLGVIPPYWQTESDLESMVVQTRCQSA